MTRNRFPFAQAFPWPPRRVRRTAACLLFLPALWTMLAVTTAWAQAPATPRDRASASVESDTWVRRDRARVSLDRPTPAVDCNRNAVDDRLDLIGAIARGPVATGRFPGHLVAADLNGDGRADLIVSNEGGSTVSVLWHRFGRRFEPGPALEVGTNPSCVAAADLDGDGDVDLVVGHSAIVGSVTVLWNDGTGAFRREDLPMNLDAAVAASPRCVAVADVDGDGRPDILATSGAAPADRMLTLMRNRGGGRFDEPARRWIDAGTPDGLAAADFDGDGLTDIAVAGGNASRGLVVVFNGGAGLGFDRWPANRFDDVGGGVVALQAVDLDGDGHVDLATANYESNDVSVLRNDPTQGRMSRFAPAVRYPVGLAPQALAVADLDDDGRPDIVVPVGDGNRVAVLHNRGAGAFDDASHLPVGTQAKGIWAGNLDSDRYAEVAVSHSPDNTVWVLHMHAQRAAPDCNANRIPDACDIAAGTSADHNRDGVPDECAPHLAPARKRW